MKLTTEQQSAVNALDGYVRIIAGAGSGKTRTVTERIAQGAAKGKIDPNRHLAVTMTRRGVAEMAERLERRGVYGVRSSTVHAFAWNEIQRLWPSSREVPRLAPHPDQCVKQALATCGMVSSPIMVSTVKAEAAWAVARMLSPAGYARSGRICPVAGMAVSRMAQVLAAYAQTKAEAGVIDYGDCLVLAAGLGDLHGGPDLQAITVDEAQDLSPMQARLVTLWSASVDSLVVVGDAEQAIFGFSGATGEYLTGAAGPSLALSKNHRSTNALVEFSNRFRTDDLNLVGNGESGASPEIIEHKNAQAEAEAIAKMVTHGQSTAVLARTGAQLPRLATSIQQAGHKVVLWTGDSGRMQEVAPDTVVVSTIHQAKGGEWAVVHLAGTDEGKIPSRLATTDGELAEEQRVFYVGITRARERLHIHFSGDGSRYLPESNHR